MWSINIVVMLLQRESIDHSSWGRLRPSHWNLLLNVLSGDLLISLWTLLPCVDVRCILLLLHLLVVRQYLSFMAHLLLGREAVSHVHVSTSLGSLVVPLDHDSLIPVYLTVACLMVILVARGTVLGTLLVVDDLLCTLLLLLLYLRRDGYVC